jgi:hypothetical protein
MTILNKADNKKTITNVGEDVEKQVLSLLEH